MSEHAVEGTLLEAQALNASSVQIEMDSKGTAKVRVKVYVGEEFPTVEAARAEAVRAFTTTKAQVA